METIDHGRISIELPADCPDKEAYRAVVKDELGESFGADKHRAEFCKAEYDRCKDVATSRDNGVSTQVAKSPGARAWQSFMDRVCDRVSAEDRYEPPAIPGWPVPSLKAQLAPKQTVEAAQPAKRTWRLDQMRIVEPNQPQDQKRSR